MEVKNATMAGTVESAPASNVRVVGPNSREWHSRGIPCQITKYPKGEVGSNELVEDFAMFDEEPEGDPHGECAKEIHELKADKAQLEYALAAVNKSAKASELQVDELRGWIRLYSECDCDVSKNKGTVHWFACRWILGRKVLGEKYETKGAESRIGEPTSLPPDRLRNCGCGEKQIAVCPVHG